MRIAFHIQRADVIVVMDQGRIVEMGRHSELLAAMALTAASTSFSFSLNGRLRELAVLRPSAACSASDALDYHDGEE